MKLIIKRKKLIYLLIILIFIIFILSMKILSEKNFQLNNTGNTYEEQLDNINKTYPPKFYEYVNNKNIFKQEIYNYGEIPNGKKNYYQFDLEICKTKNFNDNLICYRDIIFKDNSIGFGMSHYPEKDALQEESYSIEFELNGNEFTNFEVYSEDRSDRGICTFKDVTLQKPINEEEYKVDPNFGDPFEYGRVNCYDEGKRYQKIVPELEKLVDKTEENTKEFIKLSNEFKAEYTKIK